MENTSVKIQMEKIRGYEKGFFAITLINLGAKLGIFEALNESKDGLTVPVLANKLGLHEPYLKIWCQSAYHFEILDGDDQGRFRLQPFLDEILADKNNFRYYLTNIAVDADLIGPGFLKAEEPFRTGKLIEQYSSAEVSELSYEATKNIAMVFLFMIFPKNETLKQKLEQGVRFLDIGCGNGNLIIQLAQAFVNSTFVGIGPEAYGIKSAVKAIAELGLKERVSVEHLGAERLTFKEEFDIASLVVTLHEIQPAIRENAVKNIYGALKKGGHLLVLDFPYPKKLEDFRNPLYNYGILDQFYEICLGNFHLDNDQQNEILAAAGFKNLQRESIGRGMFDFITAEK